MCWGIGVVIRSIGMRRGGRGSEVETGIGIGIDK
jgi:hypothetical protein